MKWLTFLIIASLSCSFHALAQQPPDPPPVPSMAGASEFIAELADEANLSREIVAKLNAEQLADILRERAKRIEPQRDVPAVAIVVPLGFALCVFAVVGVSLMFQFRRERQRHETLRVMIEKGASIPPELLVPPSQRSDLRRGLVLLSAGVGLGFLLLMMPTAKGAWSIGVLPLLVGIGYLLSWKLESRARSPREA